MTNNQTQEVITDQIKNLCKNLNGTYHKQLIKDSYGKSKEQIVITYNEEG